MFAILSNPLKSMCVCVWVCWNPLWSLFAVSLTDRTAASQDKVGQPAAAAAAAAALWRWSCWHLAPVPTNLPRLCYMGKSHVWRALSAPSILTRAFIPFHPVWAPSRSFSHPELAQHLSGCLVLLFFQRQLSVFGTWGIKTGGHVALAHHVTILQWLQKKLSQGLAGMMHLVWETITTQSQKEIFCCFVYTANC